MTDADMTKWESFLSTATRTDIERHMPTIAEMARPEHPSSGQYTYLIGKCAERLRVLDLAPQEALYAAAREFVAMVRTGVGVSREVLLENLIAATDAETLRRLKG